MFQHLADVFHLPPLVKYEAPEDKKSAIILTQVRLLAPLRQWLGRICDFAPSSYSYQ
jgi:hypothetical protein